MIQNIADNDRRNMTRILRAAAEGRLVRNQDILTRSPGTNIYHPVDQKVAADAIELAWIMQIQQNDDNGHPLFQRTGDGATAFDQLHAWCRANPIR